MLKVCRHSRTRQFIIEEWFINVVSMDTILDCHMKVL